LLSDAHDPDPAHWPAQAKEGAAMVQRLLDIENECRRKFGRWDLDLMDQATQDEYDGIRADLGKLEDRLNPEARTYSLEEIEAEMGLPPRA